MPLYLQIATKYKTMPKLAQFRTWVKATLLERYKTHEITIRIVNEIEITNLNKLYRSKNTPTNVLSFPFINKKNKNNTILGDIVICAPIVAKEAIDQNKPIQLHWAHLTIHGTLHLLGYDHISKKQADIMEKEEIRILGNLQFKNPYDEDIYAI